MIWTILFASMQVSAAQAQLTEFFPHEVLRYEVVEFKPAKGHHLSAEAPQSCGTGSVVQRSTRAVKCQFSQAGTTQLQLNICDDSKTFCKPVQLSLNVIQGGNTPSPTVSKNDDVNKEWKHQVMPDWAEGSPSQIAKQALAGQKPVLMLISTDWCPACNEVKEYLLPTKAFSAATAEWFKVYIDGDSLVADDWNKVVPFRFYPSFVLLNSKMEEVARYTGPIRQGDFEAWALAEAKNLGDPISQLQARVEDRLNGKWLRKVRDVFSRVTKEKAQAEQARLLKYSLDQGDRELSKKLIAAGEYPDLSDRILYFKISEVENAEEKARLFAQLLNQTIQGERWAEYLATFCEADKVACKPFVDRVPERVSFLSKRTGMFDAEKESQLADEFFTLTLVYQMLDDQKALKDFANRCTEHFLAMSKASTFAMSRAGSQGLIACLELAGDFSRGEKTLDGLIKTYPTEPTFLIRKARMMRKQKKPEVALEFANRAEAFAFGYNWFNLQLLKGELWLDLKKPEQARQIVEATLGQISVDLKRDSRNQSLVSRLRGLQARASQ